MLIKTISLIAFLLFLEFPKKFYFKETKCSFAYSITKEWYLDLKTDSSFKLVFKVADTRIKKSNIDSITGKWNLVNDTLLLYPKNEKLEMPSKVSYLFKGNMVSKMDGNNLFPITLKVL